MSYNNLLSKYNHPSSLSTVDSLLTRQHRNTSKTSVTSFLPYSYPNNNNSNNKHFSITNNTSLGNSKNQKLLSENQFYQSDLLLPCVRSFDVQNKNYEEMLNYYSNEIDIISARIEKKASLQEQSIDQIYNQLKQIEKQFMQWKKQMKESDIQREKQIIKHINQKIKILFSEIKVQIREENYSFIKSQSKHQQNQLQTIKEHFKSEEKQRQKQWQQQIDSLGKMFIEIQSDLFDMKSQSEESMKRFQTHIWNLQTELRNKIYDQKRQTDIEHDIILNLINTTTEKLTHL